MEDTSRRRFIRSTGTATVLTAFAGCTGGQDGGGGQDGESGQDGGGDNTTTQTMSQMEEWAEKGKNEEDGKVAIAHYLSGETADELFAGFKEDIPWINPQGVKFSGGELLSRFESEYEAGQPTIDMVWTPGVMALIEADYMVNLKETLPAFGNIPGDAKGDHWVPNKTSAYGLLYNSDMISENELPSSWDELTNPEYKGRMIMGQSFSWMHPGVHWIEQQNSGWIDEMANQDIRFASGLGAAVKQMAAGARALNPVTNLKYPWIEDRAAGTPAKVSVETEPVFLYVNPSGVNKRAPQKNSALYLANYLCTDQGQKRIKEAVKTDCAGMNTDSLQCDPKEYHQTLTEGVDNFQFAGFLPPSEYNDFAEQWQEAMGL